MEIVVPIKILFSVGEEKPAAVPGKTSLQDIIHWIHQDPTKDGYEYYEFILANGVKVTIVKCFGSWIQCEIKEPDGKA